MVQFCLFKITEYSGVKNTLQFAAAN